MDLLFYIDYNDRDLSCIVSSLVQVMCDPHYRTISGFESLVQKEWISMGHPFTTRSGLVTDSTNEEMVDGQVRALFYCSPILSAAPIFFRRRYFYCFATAFGS